MRDGEPEPAQPGGREHQRVVARRVELPQPRVEVAADRREPRPGKQPRELRDAPDAARADRRRAAQQRDEIVERVDGPAKLTLVDVVAACSRTGSTTASRGSSRGSTPPIARPSGSTRRHVLAAVHGEIDLAAQQRVFDFLDEQPLAADLGQRRILQAIARRLDHDDAGTAGRRAAAMRRGDARSPATARAGCRACRAEARWSRHDGQSAGRVLRARERLDSPVCTRRGLVVRRLAVGSGRLVAEAEQPRQRFGVRADRVGVAERLQLLGRRQQQLFDDAGG